jgi:ParB family transcriptional regulator, chromosome partitioning protein
MAKKKRGLGKNRLDVFLSNSSWDADEEVEVKEKPAKKVAVAESKIEPKVEEPKPKHKAGEALVQLPLNVLQRGQYQPRKHMDEEALLELSESIKTQGVIQPIIVRAVSDTQYEIIAGERRWRASQLADIETIPAVIREISDEATMAIALIENIQREDLNPIEEALAIQRLVDEFASTQQEVADTLGKSRTTITNLLRLLTLDHEVRDMLADGKLDMGHSKVLLTLESEEQVKAARIISLRGLTVRETEDLVRRIKSGFGFNGAVKKDKIQHPLVQTLESDFKSRLNTKVKIQHKPSGKGKLQIQYSNLEELEALLDRIQ